MTDRPTAEERAAWRQMIATNLAIAKSAGEAPKDRPFILRLLDALDASDARVAELEAETTRRCLACADVSGALVDAGGAVPDDEAGYAEAVRAIVAERDEARDALDAHDAEMGRLRGTTRHVHPDGDGTHRLCLALFGPTGDTAWNWLGGSEARMLHDATDRIAKLEAERDAALARLAELEGR